MQAKSGMNFKRGSERNNQSPSFKGERLTQGTTNGRLSNAAVSREPSNMCRSKRGSKARSFVVNSETNLPDSNISFQRADTNPNLQDQSRFKKENSAFEANQVDQLQDQIRKLEERLRASEKRFLSQSLSFQQQKVDEIEQCFLKLFQDAEKAKADALAKLKSYFVSVNKSFQAAKAEVESKIATLNFSTQGKLSDMQNEAAKEELSALRLKVETVFLTEFNEIAVVRVAFNKSMLARISEFCKIMSPRGEGPVASSGINVFTNDEQSTQYGSLYGKGWESTAGRAVGNSRSRAPFASINDPINISVLKSPGEFVQPSQAVSEFVVPDVLKMSNRNTASSGNFLSRMPVTGVSHESNTRLNLGSLSPIPNGYRQTARDHTASRVDRLTPREHQPSLQSKFSSKSKDSAIQVLMSAISENAVGLNLNGYSLDREFLSVNRDAFARLKRLKILHLDSNKLTDDCFPLIYQTFVNSPVESISLQDNQFTERSLPLVKDWCSCRNKLVLLDLTSNELRLSEQAKHQVESEMAQFGVSLIL